LERLLQEKVRLISAGRTDSGVHALGQVANFHLQKSELAVRSIKNGLNSLLPEDIFVHEACEVEPKFNARFDAKSRVYRYRITQKFSPLSRRTAWFVPYRLDLNAIREASQYLLGRQDFTSFSTTRNSPLSRVSTIIDLDWQDQGEEIFLEIKADRFLPQMVRIIVGTMVEVGRGKLKVQDIQGILASRNRRLAGPTAPPQGLCLLKVNYE